MLLPCIERKNSPNLYYPLPPVRSNPLFSSRGEVGAEGPLVTQRGRINSVFIILLVSLFVSIFYYVCFLPMQWDNFTSTSLGAIVLIPKSYPLYPWERISKPARLYSTKLPPVPLKVYINADTLKVEILSENQGKAGVYMWINKLSGARYVGSSVDLHRRFQNYFSVLYLEGELKKGNSIINNSLLKNGYSNFRLEILEYCSPKDCLALEQFYLDLFKPEYNLLKIAGSSLGYKHTEESLVKMRGRKLSDEAIQKVSERMVGNTHGKGRVGRKLSEEEKENISKRMKGNTYGLILKGIKRSAETIAKHSERMKGNTYGAALKGIKRSEETKAKMKGRPRPEGAGSSKIALEVLDLETGNKNTYESISAFAEFLGIPVARIGSYFSSKTKRPYKGRYEMRKIIN